MLGLERSGMYGPSLDTIKYLFDSHSIGLSVG